jgi:hypothetical protein
MYKLLSFYVIYFYLLIQIKNVIRIYIHSMNKIFLINQLFLFTFALEKGESILIYQMLNSDSKPKF